ncbi:MAG: hypothetical protein GQ475_05670 [Methylococcaceae bacterium]|nr:hypothetical protein [Methylococcaceae bacterium]
MKRRNFILLSATSLLAACSRPSRYTLNPYQSKNELAPPIVHCFDTIGHKKGTYPQVLGGTCCCHPSEERLTSYQLDGFLLDYDLEQLFNEYDQRNIILEHEHGWKCNNQCKEGPHLVFGGHCMVDPVVGTQNYENITSGYFPDILKK